MLTFHSKSNLMVNTSSVRLVHTSKSLMISLRNCSQAWLKGTHQTTYLISFTHALTSEKKPRLDKIVICSATLRRILMILVSTSSWVLLWAFVLELVFLLSSIYLSSFGNSLLAKPLLLMIWSRLSMDNSKNLSRSWTILKKHLMKINLSGSSLWAMRLNMNLFLAEQARMLNMNKDSNMFLKVSISCLSSACLKPKQSDVVLHRLFLMIFCN